MHFTSSIAMKKFCGEMAAMLIAILGGCQSSEQGTSSKESSCMTEESESETSEGISGTAGEMESCVMSIPHYAEYGCFTLSEGQENCQVCDEPLQCVNSELLAPDAIDFIPLCGPYEIKDENGTQCCYHFWATYEIEEGRPFFVEGKARMAGIVPCKGWQARILPELNELDSSTRQLLAELWARDAAAEHASIASFARFVMQLLEVGAPSDLVRAAQEAIRDEIDHAELCFGLASAYGAESKGPAPLPMDNALQSSSLLAIVRATFVEGCVGETIAALSAKVALAKTKDPAVAKALATIAEDESRHAALAWRFVKWALQQNPDIRFMLQEALAELQHSGFESIFVRSWPSNVDREALANHGRLSPEEQKSLSREALRHVIAPSLQFLLEEPSQFQAANLT